MNDPYRSPCRGGGGMHERGAPSIKLGTLSSYPETT